jgi:iron complex outermembrane receptor protein
LAWDFDRSWTLSSSFGVAHRFPTVAELYQTASVGTDVKVANPFLKPEEVHSGELALTNRFQDGQARVSLFHEETYDALVSQTSFIPGGGTSTAVSNVDHIRNTGVEIYGEKNNVVFERLQVSASVTYVDSRIVANSSWAGTTVVVGKHAPYVPEWRATAAATYRPDDKWALTAALRYSGQMYSTLDNTDVVSNVYGAFDRYFVADFHANYKYSEQAQFQFGVDNVLNEKYTLFHSFPGRTFLASANLKF